MTSSQPDGEETILVEITGEEDGLPASARPDGFIVIVSFSRGFVSVLGYSNPGEVSGNLGRGLIDDFCNQVDFDPETAPLPACLLPGIAEGDQAVCTEMLVYLTGACLGGNAEMVSLMLLPLLGLMPHPAVLIEIDPGDDQRARISMRELAGRTYDEIDVELRQTPALAEILARIDAAERGRAEGRGTLH